MSSTSLFASLGAALHSFSSPKLSCKVSGGTFKGNPDLIAFESELASRLEKLKSTDEADYLSIPWLCEAMEVVTSTHTSAEAFVPDFLQALGAGDVRWLDDYLDNSVKLLDICIALKEALAEMKNYRTHLVLALHSLEKGTMEEPQLRRCKVRLETCVEILKRKDDTVNYLGQRRSKLENCSSILRRMGERLNTEDATKGNFFMVLYAAQVTTIFIGGLLSSALSFKPRRSLSTIYVGGQSAWSCLLSSLQPKVREQIEKKKSKGANALLEELDKSDIAVRMLLKTLKELPQRIPSPSKKAKVMEIKGSIKVLRACSDELHEGLSTLDAQLDGVYKILLASRMALLDMYSHS